MNERRPEARIVSVGDGQRARFQPAPSVLPPSLGMFLRLMVARQRWQLPALGYRPDCGEGHHRLAKWLQGVYGTREVLVSRCLDCETVEVRDVSLDRGQSFVDDTSTSLVRPPHVEAVVSRLPIGAALRRRNLLLGWYSGKRAAGRVYSGPSR